MRYDRGQTNTQTHRQTDTLITILRAPLSGRCNSNNGVRNKLIKAPEYTTGTLQLKKKNHLLYFLVAYACSYVIRPMTAINIIIIIIIVIIIIIIFLETFLVKFPAEIYY